MRYSKISNFADVSKIKSVEVQMKDLVGVDLWPEFEEDTPTRKRNRAICSLAALLLYTFRTGKQEGTLNGETLHAYYKSMP